MEHRIAVIAGDGIGREVVPEALRVLAHVTAVHGFSLAFTEFGWGCEHYLEPVR